MREGVHEGGVVGDLRRGILAEGGQPPLVLQDGSRPEGDREGLLPLHSLGRRGPRKWVVLTAA